MKVLISGGSGFIGSRLALSLVDLGHRVTVLDNLHPQIHGDDPESSPLYRSIAGKVRFIRGDVRVREDWLRALEGADAVMHCCAETGTGQSMYEVSRYVDVNIGGTALLFDILGNSSHTVRKVVVASSRAVYGEGSGRCAEHGVVCPDQRSDEDMRRGDFEPKCPVCGGRLEELPTREDARKHPTSVYGLTKQVQEELTLLMGPLLGISTTALRYQNVYGPGQSLSNPYTGILSIFSTRLLLDEDINIFEDGRESRDFVYVDDVVDATVSALESEACDGRVYNVGTGIATDVSSVAAMLAVEYGSASRVFVSGRYRVGDIRRCVADIAAIRRDLGFEPKVPFAVGVSRFAAWVRRCGLPEDRYIESLEEMRKRGLFR